jgi:predicted  nucleic acid-binding Zn-ribbon protein
MQQIIEKLLILQDRDRRILHIREQLARVQPERQSFQGRAAATQAGLEAVKTKAKQVESDRKKLELEVNPRSSKSSATPCNNSKPRRTRNTAPWPTRSTLARKHRPLEDGQLELMEQAETLQKEAAAASRQAEEARKLAEGQLRELAAREQSLRDELTALESNRNQLTAALTSGLCATTNACCATRATTWWWALSTASAAAAT